ncbi:dTDP-4-dehydrorhamnose 3,5-epimerase [Robiginitalea sp. IMCC44478]|uniref:dTDP-4-dehydrorhamnose 3,5-epimerase n=1 Tax=Robiginitalea sp. IMCC44478 TaxID=3459122 RepID=UPI0040437B19
MYPRIIKDSRGYFMEKYNAAELEKCLGQRVHFVQDNLSSSAKNVLRGLHFQQGEHAQAKLVQVLRGAVLDVVVDLRPESPTYGRHYSTELSERDHKMVFIPKGMAHGFLSLEEGTLFSYKCDAYYHPGSEGGIIYNDPELSIDWGKSEDKLILSDKDRELPLFKDIRG